MRLRRESRPGKARRKARIPGRYKIVALLVTFGLVGSIAGAYAAFTATTSNSGNIVSTGTVTTTDSQSGTALFNLSNMKPTDAAVTKCIEVTYTGSLPANMGYVGGQLSGTGLYQYINLTMTRGLFLSGGNPTSPDVNCANFTADGTNYIGAGGGVVFSGLLSTMGGDEAHATTDPYNTTPEVWTNTGGSGGGNEKHAYKLTVSLQNNSAAQGLTSAFVIGWGLKNT